MKEQGLMFHPKNEALFFKVSVYSEETVTETSEDTTLQYFQILSIGTLSP